MAYGNQEDMMDGADWPYKCAMEVNGSPIISYEGQTRRLHLHGIKIDMTESVIKVTEFRSIRSMVMRKLVSAQSLTEWMLRKLTIGLSGKIIAEMFDRYCEDIPGLLDGQCS